MATFLLLPCATIFFGGDVNAQDLSAPVDLRRPFLKTPQMFRGASCCVNFDKAALDGSATGRFNCAVERLMFHPRNIAVAQLKKVGLNNVLLGDKSTE